MYLLFCIKFLNSFHTMNRNNVEDIILELKNTFNNYCYQTNELYAEKNKKSNMLEVNNFLLQDHLNEYHDPDIFATRKNELEVLIEQRTELKKKFESELDDLKSNIDYNCRLIIEMNMRIQRFENDDY